MLCWPDKEVDTSYPTLADTRRLFCHWFVFKAVSFGQSVLSHLQNGGIFGPAVV